MVTDDMIESAAKALREELGRFRRPAQFYIDDEARDRLAKRAGIEAVEELECDGSIDPDDIVLESYRILARIALSAGSPDPT